MAIGSVNVAPWQPVGDAALIEAAPGRSTSVVALAAIATWSPLWATTATPVVPHVPDPPVAVTVPFGAMATRATA